MPDDIQIKILSRVLTVPFNNTPTEASKILVADDKTIAFMQKKGFGLTFEVKLDNFEFYLDPKTGRIHCSHLPEILIDKKLYNPVLVHSETLSERKNYADTFVGKDGIFQFHISASEVEQFFNKGTFTLVHSNRWPCSISIKINENNEPKKYSVGNFLLASNELYENKYLAFTNFFDSFQQASLLNPFWASKTFTFYIRGLYNSCPPSFFSYFQGSKEGFIYKPYALARLVPTNPKFVDYNAIPNDKTVLDFEVPTYEYDGVVCAIEQDKNKEEFVSLIPPSTVQWKMVEGKRYLPINLKEIYQRFEINPTSIENSSDPTYTFLPPTGEGLAIELRFYDPATKSWTQSIYNLADKTGTDIVYNAEINAWGSVRNDRWDQVKERSLTAEEKAMEKALMNDDDPSNDRKFDLRSKIVKGVNKNFSVMCTYKQTSTIGEAYGLLPPNSRNSSDPDDSELLNRCVPLAHYLPEEKIQRNYWASAKYVCIQQSSFGSYSDRKTSMIVKLDANNKIVEKFNKDEHLGSPFEVDAKDFHDGKIAIVLGPNTTRLDIAPYQNTTCSNELHTVLAGGYHQKNMLGSKINY